MPTNHCRACPPCLSTRLSKCLLRPGTGRSRSSATRCGLSAGAKAVVVPSKPVLWRFFARLHGCLNIFFVREQRQEVEAPPRGKKGPPGCRRRSIFHRQHQKFAGPLELTGSRWQRRLPGQRCGRGTRICGSHRRLLCVSVGAHGRS